MSLHAKSILAYIFMNIVTLIQTFVCGQQTNKQMRSYRHGYTPLVTRMLLCATQERYVPKLDASLKPSKVLTNALIWALIQRPT